VGAHSVCVLVSTGGAGAVLAIGGAVTVLAVVGSRTTGVVARGGGPVVNVAVHGVDLTVGPTDLALPALVVTTVLKPVGVLSVGPTISIAVPARVVAMATGRGVARFLVVLIRPVRPLVMVAAWVVVLAVLLPVVVFVVVAVLLPVVVVVVVFVVVVVVVVVAVLLPVVVAAAVFVPVVVLVPVGIWAAVVVPVPVVAAVRAVVSVPGPVTLPVAILVPALTNTPERRT
jgi:hypothetical protein